MIETYIILGGEIVNGESPSGWIVVSDPGLDHPVVKHGRHHSISAAEDAAEKLAAAIGGVFRSAYEVDPVAHPNFRRIIDTCAHDAASRAYSRAVLYSSEFSKGDEPFEQELSEFLDHVAVSVDSGWSRDRAIDITMFAIERFEKRRLHVLGITGTIH